MKKQTIVVIAKHAESRPHLSIEIVHSIRNTKYRVLGFIRVRFNGQYYVQVYYQALLGGRIFSRNTSEFVNFNEISL